MTYANPHFLVDTDWLEAAANLRVRRGCGPERRLAQVEEGGPPDVV
jgi:hypothetical protein